MKIKNVIVTYKTEDGKIGEYPVTGYDINKMVHHYMIIARHFAWKFVSAKEI
jgi:hypothetical protein